MSTKNLLNNLKNNHRLIIVVILYEYHTVYQRGFPDEVARWKSGDYSQDDPDQQEQIIML